MYVSIMKTDPSLKNDAQGISCLLYIPESEIDDGVIVDSRTPLWFDVTEKYYYVYEYTKRLNEASKEVDIPIEVLHAFIKDRDKLLNKQVLDKQFDGALRLEKIHLHGYYYGKPVYIFLNDPRFKEVTESLRTNFYDKCKTVEIQGINSRGDAISTPDDMKSFIENHNYEICNRLFRQSENYLIDTKNTGMCMEIPKKGYAIQINTRNPNIIIRNVKDGRYAYMSGPTTFMIQGKRDPSFDRYIRRTLDLIGLEDLWVWSLYKIILTINTCEEVNFYDKDRFDIGNMRLYDENISKSTQCPDCKMGKLPLPKIQMQGVTDEDYTDTKETKLPDISMNNLRWFLLYLADTVILPDVKISHALPIYVYKNNVGKLSATFNYMEKEPDSGVHKLWDELRLKFTPADVDDILSYYDRNSLIAYKTYVRTRPNVRVIIDDEIIIN